jgi:hypothetical protein
MRYIRQLVWFVAALFGLGWTLAWVSGLRAATPDSIDAIAQRAEARGYRVRGVRWDPVLQQRWVVLESIAHPERPAVAELTGDATPAPASTAAALVATNQTAFLKPSEMAVRSGDRVVLWSAEPNMRMQMGAVAEANAAVGDRIALRVTGAGINGDTGWRAYGVVRGPGSVELEP